MAEAELFERLDALAGDRARRRGLRALPIPIRHSRRCRRRGMVTGRCWDSSDSSGPGTGWTR
jgi:hypothetical protein